MSEVGNPFAVLCPVSSYYTNLSLHAVLPSHPSHRFTGYTKYASHKLNQVKYFFLTAKHESKHSKLTQGQPTPTSSSSFLPTPLLLYLPIFCPTIRCVRLLSLLPKFTADNLPMRAINLEFLFELHFLGRRGGRSKKVL